MSENLETKVEVVRHDVDQLAKTCERVEVSIEKLTDLGSSLKSMLALHELKLAQHDLVTKNFETTLEARRVQSENQFLLTQQRTDQAGKELKGEMEEQQRAIIAEVKGLRDDIKKYHDELLKIKGIMSKFTWFFSAVGVLIIFILWKIGILPSSVVDPATMLSK